MAIPRMREGQVIEQRRGKEQRCQEKSRRMPRAQREPQTSKGNDGGKEEEHVAVEAEVAVPVGHRCVEPIIDKPPQAQGHEPSRMRMDEVESLTLAHLDERNLSHV